MDSPSSLNVEILEEIGGYGFNAQTLASQVKGFDGDNVVITVNSYGGSVTEGFAIYNIIKGLRANTVANIAGYAMSMGTVITAAADTVTMPENGYYMIHEPWTVAAGDSSDMEKNAELLEQMANDIAAVYAKRTGLTKAKVRKMMKEETWLTPKEAKKLGFIDKITDGVEINASFSGEYRNIPKDLINPKNNMNEFLNNLRSKLGFKSDASEKEILDKVGELTGSRDEIVNSVLERINENIDEKINNAKTSDEHIKTLIKENVNLDGYAKTEDIPTTETIKSELEHDFSQTVEDAKAALETEKENIIKSLGDTKQKQIDNHVKSPSSEESVIMARGATKAANESKY